MPYLILYAALSGLLLGVLLWAVWWNYPTKTVRHEGYGSWRVARRGCSIFGWGTVIFVSLSVVGLFIGGDGIASSRSCNINADGLNLDSNWSYEAGCRVMVKGRWVSIDKYRFALED